MSMFCFQCQETMKNSGCNGVKGVCGKTSKVANLQDLLIYLLKGIAYCQAKRLSENEDLNINACRFVVKSLFTTITNVNFSEEDLLKVIKDAVEIRDDMKDGMDLTVAPEAAVIGFRNDNEIYEKSESVGVLVVENDDIRSLRELLIYGLKGIAAYADHAEVLGYEDNDIYQFVITALDSTLRDLSVEEMIEWVMKCGEYAVKTMALLDKANTESYGHPEMTEVNIGVGSRPGILISGHDLKDFEELLEQTKNKGIDVYTHGEMLPANYYPKFKNYEHLYGNYGGSWWKQKQEFEAFNGPILMTTNCLVPPSESYAGRVFTTGRVSFPGVSHIEDRKPGGTKDFKEIIKMALESKPPEKLEEGSIIGGFAHEQVVRLADKVVEAVKNGDIKRFIVMAGCDGRHGTRDYFTRVAENLPNDTVVLTAGCAKYRYNKLSLGSINGIPRVLDAGQCNDSYSLAFVALKLKEIFNVEDINELPISFDVAWYEQKAVTVLLALLYLGFKKIRLGPTLPAFLSPNVVNVLVEKFSIKPIGKVDEDIAAMLEGN